MEIGDIIISRGNEEYSITEFITIKNEIAVNLKSLNGSNSFTMMKVYLNYYISTGMYTIKRKNNNIKKFKRRNYLHKG